VTIAKRIISITKKVKDISFSLAKQQVLDQLSGNVGQQPVKMSTHSRFGTKI